MARAARLTAGIAALAAALWALVGRGLVNYDTLYSIVWGREIVQGRTPDLDAVLAPTQHPLATLAGVLAAPLSIASDAGVHGEAAQTATIVVAFLALATLGWVVFALGSAWFDPWVGVLAAAIVLTRRPVLDFGARAYVDIPYVALVLGALLVETRRPRSGAPVLLLLAVAGLIRPEAWLFSAAYLVYLVWRGERDARRLALLAALAASAPVLWALTDWILAGSPVHSLTGTRDTAETLDRVTGLGEVPLTVPRRLGEILREPVLVGAAGGLVLSWLWLRDRVRPAVVAGVLALAAFCVLAAAGLPILGRYLLLPAAIGAILCGAGAFGWRTLPEDDPRRRPWAWFGVLTLVAARRVRSRAGGAHQRPARRAAHPGHDPGRPARARARAARRDRTGLRARRRAEPPAGPAPRALAQHPAREGREPPGAHDRARDVRAPRDRAGGARLHPRPARPAQGDPAAAHGLQPRRREPLVARVQTLRPERPRPARRIDGTESGPCTPRRGGLAGPGAGARLRLGESRHARR